MSDSNKLRVQFRPVPYVQEIHQEQNRDPAFRYKNVIITYKSDPNRVQRYLQRGWEIVETTSPSKNDKAFTPNSKEDKLRPQMRVETTTDGHEQILMRILWTKDTENRLDDKDQREQWRIKEAKRRGDKIIKRGNEVITTGTELSDKIQEL